MNDLEKKIETMGRKGFSRGFSLIELMVVVTLMAVLVSIGTVFFMGRLETGKIQAARTQAYEIAKAMDLYKLQFGDYPTVSEGIEALAHPPHGQPIMNEIPKDPWGNEFNYAVPGTHNPRSFDVWSNGPSGSAQDGSGEIGNWPEESK